MLWVFEILYFMKIYTDFHSFILEEDNVFFTQKQMTQLLGELHHQKPNIKLHQA